MGALCSATKDNPCFSELTIRVVGSYEDRNSLSPELLKKYKSLISEGREIDEFFQNADPGLKLYQVAIQEKTEQALDACYTQIAKVSENVVRYLTFRDSLIAALVFLIDYINGKLDAPFVMDLDNLSANVAKMNNPAIGDLVVLLTQICDIFASIDKKFLSKNFDSTVGIFRRLVSDKSLDIDHPLYELSTSQTISMTLSGPGPTLRALVQTCTYTPAVDPRTGESQQACPNCGSISCACDCDKHSSDRGHKSADYFFDLTKTPAPREVIERRCGFLLTLINGVLGTLKRDPSLRTGLDSVYYRRLLLCGTACLNALYTDYLRRFMNCSAEAATGVFHSICPLSVLSVCTAINLGEDEGLFLRYNLTENARKANDKPADSNAILSIVA